MTLINQNFQFIDNAPCGVDLFEGQAQDKIADNIVDVIRNNTNSHILGIDGGWGSGKSNLVKLIEKKLGKQAYHFFIYDAWGHQEDLQRRSLLEELTENLTTNEIVPASWNNNLKLLLAKIKETESKKVPKLSLGISLIAFALLLVPVFKVISDVVVNRYAKMIILGIPFIILILFYLYYLITRTKKNQKFLERLNSAFATLFLEYQNKSEEEIKYETISEDEPTVRKFRNWMTDISKDLVSKRLVLVFDNMDRLPAKKVQELWSSIHVFFAENKYDNIKVIVPFDREHIKGAFKGENGANGTYGDDFINKTFNIIYRVSPPILTDWKKYFEMQWKVAFPGSYNNNDSYNSVIQIFDILSKEITPRKIISFINEFVTIKQFFKLSIPDQYVALFILGKESIVKNPLQEIIKPTYLESLSFFYQDDDDLPKYIAALFYQVDPQKAIEVVFTDKLKRSLNQNDISTAKTISDINEFPFILENAITDISNIENAVLCLNQIDESSLGNGSKAVHFWNCLYKKVTTQNLVEVLDYQIILLKKTSYKDAYLKQLLNNFITNDEFDPEKYYTSINKLLELKLQINLFDTLIERKIKAPAYISLVDRIGTEIKQYKLNCSSVELNTHLKAIDVSALKNLGYLAHLAKLHDLNEFLDHLKTVVINNKSTFTPDQMGSVYYALKIVAPEKPLGVVLEENFIHNLYIRCENTNEFYYDLIAMRLSRFENFNSSYASEFQKHLETPTEETIRKVAERIEYYVNFDNYFSKVNAFSQHLLYSSAAKKLIVDDYGVSKADISNLIRDYPHIKNRLGVEPRIILDRFDRWSSQFSNKIKIENFKSNVPLSFILDSYHSENSLGKQTINLAREYLSSLSLEDWHNCFAGKDNYSKAIIDLIEDFILPQSAIDASKNVLRDVAETTLQIPSKDSWQATIDRLLKQNKSPKTIFNAVRDVFIRKDNMTVELFLFFGHWLFQYADLVRKEDVMRTIFNDKVSRNDSCLEIIIANTQFMKEIINQRPDDSLDFKGVIREKLSSSANETLKEFAKALGFVFMNIENTNPLK